MGGRWLLMGGRAPPRAPYNLSTEYNNNEYKNENFLKTTRT